MVAIRSALPTDTSAIVAINAAGRPGVYPLPPETMAPTPTDAPCAVVTQLDGRAVGYMIGYTAGDLCANDEFAWFRAHMRQFLYIDQIAVPPVAPGAVLPRRVYRPRPPKAVQGESGLRCLRRGPAGMDGEVK